RQYGQRGECWSGQRYDDAEERAEGACTVDGGGLFELAGYGQEELPHEEGPECAEDPGDDQAGVRVPPAESSDDDEQRGDDDRERHHEGGEVHGEESVATAELEARERVAGHGTDD